jgi:multidrug efflux pump
MSRKIRRYVDIGMKDPNVSNMIGFCGGTTAMNQGRMFITLKSPPERKLSVDKVIAELSRKFAEVPGATLYMQAQQDLRVGGRLSNAQYQYTLYGDDLKDLNAWAPRVVEKMRTLPGLMDVNSDQQNRGLEANLTLDRTAASRLGLTPALIDNTLYDAFGQRQVSTMYNRLNQYHVVMEVESQYLQNPDGLKHIYVFAGESGETKRPVALSTFAQYTMDSTPLVVNHQSQFPSVTISFNLRPGMSLGTAVAAVEKAGRDMGLPATIHGKFAGTAQAFQDSVANEPILILAALLAVYIVLGMLYESLNHPITILSTLPSAGVGALLALLLCHTTLSVIALIGIILLIGIVKKNAIMMIDFALDEERQSGKSPEEAIRQACLMRFRPITMTTMCAMLGGLPLALGLGEGGELRQPLGIAIVGGLIFSQALTLFTTPVIYLYMDRFRQGCARILHGGRQLRDAMQKHSPPIGV